MKMEKKKLKSWDEFENELILINERVATLQKDKKLNKMEYPLYRGITSSGYHLESTLERIRKGIKLSDYLTTVKIIHKHIETCTGRKWDLETKISLGAFDLPAYEFMAYLRHNGFPSPLIDWTKSPYIAAYFAFRNISSKAKSVSVFVHMGRIHYGQQPFICILGPTIATDSKHFLQQSEYSLCVEKKDGELYFANHEDVSDDDNEDFLVKYTIPASERQKVLKRLDYLNITAYSLFDSGPNLMETLSIRELFLS